MSYSIRYSPAKRTFGSWKLILSALGAVCAYVTYLYGADWYLSLAQACGALIDAPF